MRCANTEVINKYLKEQELKALEDQKLESAKYDIEEEIREGKFDLIDSVIEYLNDSDLIAEWAKNRLKDYI